MGGWEWECGSGSVGVGVWEVGVWEVGMWGWARDGAQVYFYAGIPSFATHPSPPRLPHLKLDIATSF